jgi:hypothetical protein
MPVEPAKTVYASMHILMHGENTGVEALMGRRALSTHIREGSPLAAEYDRFVEMQGFESNSEAMRHLIREGVRPYSRFQVYLQLLGVSWLAMLALSLLASGLVVIFQSNVWLLVAQNAWVATIIGACLVIGGGGYMIISRARYAGTGIGAELWQLLPGGEST